MSCWIAGSVCHWLSCKSGCTCHVWLHHLLGSACCSVLCHLHLSCRLLLKITAMRYGCLNHTTFDACSADQHNWCTWHDESSNCVLEYADADFVHLLLWSGASIGCQGSKIQQIVQCSYLAASDACKTNGPCMWVEGACYPCEQLQLVFIHCLPCSTSCSLWLCPAMPAVTWQTA